MLPHYAITPLRVLRGLAARLRPAQPLVADIVARQCEAETAAVGQIASLAETVESTLASITAEIRAGLADDGVLDAEESAEIAARVHRAQTSAHTAATTARHLTA